MAEIGEGDGGSGDRVLVGGDGRGKTSLAGREGCLFCFGG